MQPERWRQVREVLEAALDREPGERDAFLDTACGSDAPLRAEVASLLVAHEKAGEFTDVSAFETGMRVIGQAEAPAPPGRRIGPYEILREIGRGGMGIVYLASRADDAFRKEVAIKVLKRGLDTDDVVQRFRGERQILANLDHPNITRLLDGGTTEDGLPYFVMEYIQGETIDKYCGAHQLDLTARLQLFRTICAAVHYAHQNLVIHRDIKSRNVLVTESGVPRLLDFGIAKLLTADSAAGTMTVQRLMTPDFASPEQVRGGTITTATDVYSLGVLLYELLAGRRPFRRSGLTAAEMERAICVEEPERPSAVAAGPEKLRRRLRGDLDNIVLMAMRKEPGRRYSSAEQFSEDIRRHLEGLPVMARPDSPGYRAAKFVGRHKVGVAAAALILLTLSAGVGATAWEARVAARQARAAAAERDRARVEKAKAERVNAFLQSMLGYSDMSWASPNIRKNPDIKVSEVVEQAAARVRTELANQPEVLAETERTLGNIYLGLAQWDRAENLLRPALEQQIKLYGAGDPEVARTSLALAIAAFRKDNLAEADRLFRGAVVIYRREAKAGTLDIVGLPSALAGVALVLVQKGDAKEAEAWLREALQYAPQMTGNNRALAAQLRNNLGGVLYARGDLTGAERLGRAAIEDYRSLPGHKYAELAISLVNVGAVLTRKGQYAEAEAFEREGVDMGRELFGARHAITAGMLVSLGEVLYYRGEYQRAEQTIQEALRIYTWSLPAGHSAFSEPLRVLGVILNKTGRSREGEEYLRQALAIRARVQPNDHQTLRFGVLEGGLGECLLAQKRYAEAEPLLLRSYQIVKSSVHGQEVLTGEAIQRLRDLYVSWRKPEEAARYKSLLALAAAERPASEER